MNGSGDPWKCIKLLITKLLFERGKRSCVRKDRSLICLAFNILIENEGAVE